MTTDGMFRETVIMIVLKTNTFPIIIFKKFQSNDNNYVPNKIQDLLFTSQN